MDGSRSREQHLATVVQRVQLLLQNEGLLSRVIEKLPLPVAIFERSGVVRMANDALLQQAGISGADILDERINLLNRVTNQNYAVFEAVEDSFLGDTTVVRALVSPLLLFCRGDYAADPDPYHTAIFFPVSVGDSIAYGAVVLME